MDVNDTNDVNYEEKQNMSPKEKKMATENLAKLVIVNSLPTIFGMLINALYNVVDKFWVGQIPGVGENALAGVGLINPVMLIIFGFAQLVGVGAAATISIALGKKDKDGAERILGNAFSLSIIISILITFFGIIFKDQILVLLGASENTIVYADEYLSVMFYGTIFNVLSFAMNQPIRASGNSMRFASSQFLGAAINMVLDPILILYFDMGVRGAAIATVFSMFCSSVWVMSYYFTGKSPLVLQKKYFKLVKNTVLTIFSIGMSFFLMQTAAGFVSIAINHLLIYYGQIEFGNGDLAVGAMTIINGVFALTLMPIIGINQGTQPIIGYNYGAGDYERVKWSYIWSVVYSMVICTVCFFIIEIYSVEIASLFNKNPDLVSISSYGMRIAFAGLIFIGFSIPSGNLFVATGRPKISIFLTLLRQIVILLPAFFILPAIFGFNGIWFAMPFSDIVATIVTVFFIVREFRILKIKMPKKVAV